MEAGDVAWLDGERPSLVLVAGLMVFCGDERKDSLGGWYGRHPKDCGMPIVKPGMSPSTSRSVVWE